MDLASLLTNKSVWLGLALLALTSFGAMQSHRLKNSQQEVGEQKALVDVAKQATQEAADANASNQDTIKRLQAQIETMIAQRKLDAEQRDAEIAKRDAAIVAARQETDRFKRKISNAFKSSADCTNLQGVRIDAVCPDVAVGLRERTSGHYKD